MTLKETKNKVAQDLGYEDWKELVKDQSSFGDAWFDLIVTNVATLHSIEKVKEALLPITPILEYFDRGLSDVAEGSGEEQPMHKEIKKALEIETELIENIKNEK